MFYGATPDIFEYTRRLRSKPTNAEKVLWNKLNRKQLGVKFRRQHPIYVYVADFYCHEKKIVIEVDGDYHLESDQRERDEIREEDIGDLGIKVIRFRNDQILEKIDEVVEEIKRVVAFRTPGPFLRTSKAKQSRLGLRSKGVG